MNLFKIIIIFLFLEYTLCVYHNIYEDLRRNFRRLMKAQEGNRVSHFKYDVKLPNGTLYIKFKFVQSKKNDIIDDNIFRKIFI